MALYSLLLFRDSKLIGRRAHDCDDDLDAVDFAYTLCGDHAVEVWQADRLVAHIKQGTEPPTVNDPVPG